MTNLIYGQTNYKIGDTLNVLSFSGLILRNSPTVNGLKIDKLEFGDKVVIHEIFKDIDTIELRVGNWVSVSMEKKSGYVFDGFLSTLNKPQSAELEEGDLMGYMERINSKTANNYCSVEFEYPSDSDKKGGPATVTKLSENIIYMFHIDYECRTHQYIFSDRREAELFCLLDLFYSNMKCCNTNLLESIKAQNLENLKKFTLNRIGGMGFDFHSGLNRKSISYYECN